MNEKSNENMVRMLYEDFNNRNFLAPKNSWDNYLTDDFRWTDPGKNEMDGKSFTQYFAWMVGSFPDVKANIDIIPSKGNVVVVRYECLATFSKDFEGFGQSIPAHGKKFSWDGVDLYDFGDSKIKSCTTFTNPELIFKALRGE